MTERPNPNPEWAVVRLVVRIQKAVSSAYTPTQQFRERNLEPAPWTVEDSAAIGVMMAHRFGSGGGGELRNLRLFDQLRKKFGEAEARKLFDDLLWQNDPKSPTTISNQDMKPPAAFRSARSLDGFGQQRVSAFPLPPVGDPAALERAAVAASQEAVLVYNAQHGLATRWGSYRWRSEGPEAGTADLRWHFEPNGPYARAGRVLML